MALVTQVNPYILIGDTMADLPDPALVNEGTLFHDRATRQCRILEINPTTQVRSWQEFCAAAPTQPPIG